MSKCATLLFAVIIGVCLHLAPTPAKARYPLKNVAKGKLAKQQNTYDPFEASSAVDGNLETPSVANGALHIWWAVDLTRVLPVQRVVVTTASFPGSEWYYDGLTVSVANKAPWISAPVWPPNRLCGRYSGPTLTELPANLTIWCPYPGRYVVVQDGHNFPMLLVVGEVQVFLNGWKWHGYAGHRLINNTVKAAKTVSVADCQSQCLMHDVCDAVNFRRSDKLCEFSTHLDGYDPDDIVDDHQWMFWNITNEPSLPPQKRP